MPEKSDEELLALMAAEEAAKGPPPVPPQEPIQVEPCNATPILNFFKKLTGADMLCFFGDTGAGKSKIACEMALAEQRGGGQVCFFDTEQGFHPHVVETMKAAGIDYRRISSTREILQCLRNLNATLIIVDSATLDVTGRWASLPLEGRGKLLQDLQNLYYMLKDYCHKRDALIIVTAQPVSVFGGRGLEILGDKANFFLKTEIYLQFEMENFTVKKRFLRVFKSRTLPEGTTICDLRTTSTGMEFGPINPEALRLVE